MCTLPIESIAHLKDCVHKKHTVNATGIIFYSLNTFLVAKY